MIRINKPLTKQISLVFTILVTFSLFLGCGDEGNILEPPEAEWETKRIFLLAPNFVADDEDLRTEFNYAFPEEEEPREFTIKKDGTILNPENNYWVGITAHKNLRDVKVIYTVKCVMPKTGDVIFHMLKFWRYFSN